MVRAQRIGRGLHTECERRSNRALICAALCVVRLLLSVLLL